MITAHMMMEHSKDKSDKTEIRSSESRRVLQAYEPGSIWENLLYGVGTAIVMMGPLLIPGLTLKDWLLEFFGGVMVIFFVVCLLGAWQSLNRVGRSQRRTGR